MILRLAAGCRRVLRRPLFQAWVAESGARDIDEISDGAAELLRKHEEHTHCRVAQPTLDLGKISQGDALDILLGQPCETPGLADVRAHKLLKPLLFHGFKLPVDRTVIHATKVPPIMRVRIPFLLLLLVAGVATACTDPALSKCKSLAKSRAPNLELAVDACRVASKRAGEPGEEAKALLAGVEAQLRQAEADRVARENYVPPTITEAWCDEFADRYYARALAGFMAQEKTKKYSQRKTQQYLERIVADDAAFKRVYCKDHAGEPSDGYYACMFRATFDGYENCEKARQENERRK